MGIPGTSGTRAADPAARLERRVLVTVGVLTLGGLMVVLDVTIVNVAIGRLSAALHAPLPTIQWVATAYTLALATVMPVTAWAVGRFGARQVYLAALTLFVVGSVLVGSATNVQALVAARVLQGLGGGLVMPVAMTIVLRAVPQHQRGRIMGLLGLPVLVGPVVGPSLGGWILDTASWRWLFFVNVPIGLLALLVCARRLPRDRGDRHHRLDALGLVLLSPGLALLVLGIAQTGRHGTPSTPAAWLPLVVGAGLLAGFGVRALTIAHPLVDLRLLRVRSMASGSAILMSFAAAYFGSMFLVPLYYQVVRGDSATTSGLLLVPQALATGISMQLASRLVDRLPAHRVIGTGTGLALAGYGGFAVSLGPATPYPELVGWLVLAGVGVGATLMPTMSTATRILDHHDVPSGTTLLNIANQVAVSLGTAAISVYLATQMHARLPRAVHGGVGGLYRLTDNGRAVLGEELADAFQHTFALPWSLVAAAFTLAVLLLPRLSAATSTAATARSPDTATGEERSAMTESS